MPYAIRKIPLNWYRYDVQFSLNLLLEEYFFHVVGGERSTGEEEVLQWLA